MDEGLQRLLSTPQTSGGAFRGGQIALGFDPSAIYQYSQGIQNPNAAPVIQTQQETTTPQAVTQTFDDPVYTPNWSLDTPPVVVRIPEGFNPANPSHTAAAQQAYQTAYDEKALGEAALEFLANADAKKAQIKSANDAVARYSRDVQRLEAQRKIGKSEIPTQEGIVVLPMGPKETAKNLADLGAAKQGLAQAEKTLAAASEPVRPKVIQVQLPTEQPIQSQQQGQQPIGFEERLPDAKPEVPTVSAQRQKYNMYVSRLKQRANSLLQSGASPSAVNAGYKQALENLNSTWTPELHEVNGVVYSYNTPNKPEIVRDNVNIVKQEFNEITQRIRKNVENIDQIEALRKTAEEASTAKGQDRAARIEALKASLKSINNAIGGTPDALSQNEYLRLGGSLQAWDFIKAIQPDSMANFFTTNPAGFAKSVEVLRNMTGSRMVSAFNQADKIAGKYPVLKDLVPEKPSYYSQITKGYDQGQIIERGQSASQQGTQAVSQGGSKYIIRKVK